MNAIETSSYFQEGCVAPITPPILPSSLLKQNDLYRISKDSEDQGETPNTNKKTKRRSNTISQAFYPFLDDQKDTESSGQSSKLHRKTSAPAAASDSLYQDQALFLKMIQLQLQPLITEGPENGDNIVSNLPNEKRNLSQPGEMQLTRNAQLSTTTSHNPIVSSTPLQTPSKPENINSQENENDSKRKEDNPGRSINRHSYESKNGNLILIRGGRGVLIECIDQSCLNNNGRQEAPSSPQVGGSNFSISSETEHVSRQCLVAPGIRRVSSIAADPEYIEKYNTSLRSPLSRIGSASSSAPSDNVSKVPNGPAPSSRSRSTSYNRAFSPLVPNSPVSPSSSTIIQNVEVRYTTVTVFSESTSFLIMGENKFCKVD